MNRIDAKFNELRLSGRKGFIPFVTAGDPNMETSREIILKLADLGADLIELGVPFSDPMADGPTIQLSSLRALQNGVNIRIIFEMVRSIRDKTDVPLVLFSYFNPLLSYGIERLAEDAYSVGIDGILITDVIDAEAEEIAQLFRPRNINLISLIAPTTTDKRLEKIAKTAGGFLYAVSRAGVTGARSETSSEAESLVARARRFTDLPIAVGFGISTAEQIVDVWRYADAAVVGSAIVAKIANAEKGEELDGVERLVRSLLPQFAKTGAEI